MFGIDFSPKLFRIVLNQAIELYLQAARQIQRVVAFHQERYSPLARLRVHPHYRLVIASYITGVNRQVRNCPNYLVLVTSSSRNFLGTLIKALLNGILMRARKGSVNQIAGIGLARISLHAGAILYGFAHPIQVGQIQHGVDSLGIKIHRQSN